MLDAAPALRPRAEHVLVLLRVRHRARRTGGRTRSTSALLTETGLVGAALFLVYLVYLFRRLGALRRIGRALAAAGDAAAARVRPLGWGLTAALVGTLVANVFYLTMQMYYFFVFAMLVLAAPVVFSRAVGSAARARVG